MSGLGLASGSGGAMSPETARRLAALITADAQQLEDRAQEQGVTAFLGRAVKRERPNERFLQNTLRNLASSNKRKEEKAMWAAWQAEQEQQQEQQERQQDRQQSLRGSQHPLQQQQERQGAPKGPARQHGDYSTRAREPGAGGKRTRSQSPGRSYSRKSRRSRSRSRSPCGRAHSRGRSRSSSRERHQSSRRTGQSSPQWGASPPGPAGREGTHQPAEALPNGRDDQDWSDGDAGADQQLLQWLAGSKAVKGRGSIGPHADVTGPYLPAPENPEQLKEGSAKGPAKPSWLQGSGEGDVRMKPNAAFLRGVLAAQGVAAVRGRGQPSKAGGGSSSTDSSSSESSSSSSDDSKRQRERKRSKHKWEGSSKQHKKHKKAKKARKKSSKHRRQ